MDRRRLDLLCVVHRPLALKTKNMLQHQGGNGHAVLDDVFPFFSTKKHGERARSPQRNTGSCGDFPQRNTRWGKILHKETREAGEFSTKKHGPTP